MRRTLLVWAAAALGLLPSISDSLQEPGVRGQTRITATPLSEDFGLLNRVPASALLALSVSELDRRWGEIRSTAGLANFQDALLSGHGLAADVIPRLAGQRCVFFLAPADRWPFAVPVGILQPPDFVEAQAILRKIPDIAYVKGDGVLWVGPADAGKLLGRLAREEGRKFPEAVPLKEIEERLPPGGLVRGCLNSSALLQLLRASAIDTCPFPFRGAVAALAAELSAVRYAGFRRDLIDGDFTTDGLVVYDPTRLPPEVAGTLNPAASPVVMPAAATGLHMPDGSQQWPFLAVAFRPESQAWMPWIRYLAASDPRGPLRNLGFWVEEFQHRYARNLELDLFEVLGDHAWLLATRSQHKDSIEIVLILELDSGKAIEGVLQDLFAWAGEQVWLSSFGIVTTRSWQEQQPGRFLGGLTLRTPLSSMRGPAFEVADRYLVVALEPSGLATGRAWIESLESEQPTARQAITTAGTHGIVLIQPSELARLVKSLRPAEGVETDTLIPDAVLALMADFETLRVDMQYQADGITLHGRLGIGER